MLRIDCSELDRVDGEAARSDIARAARKRAGSVRSRVVSVLFSLGFGFGVLSLLLSLGVWPARSGIAHSLAMFALVMSMLVVGSVAREIVLHRQYAQAVRRLLNERGIATCVRCGYDLRSQTGSPCPECGNTFDPALLKTEPKAPGEQEKSA